MVGKRIEYRAFICIIPIFLIMFLFMGQILYAEEMKKELPPRLISITPEYTGVIVPTNKSIDMDIYVKNGGSRDEDINLKIIAIPEGWDAYIKTYNFKVTGVSVKSDSSKDLRFYAEPDENVEPGEYVFIIKADTDDNKLSDSCRLVINVEKETADQKPKGISISTSYPVLEGPTDGEFEFSLEVGNETGKDDIFNLIAQGPENWEIRFKPAYEDKFFSSLRIKAGQKESLAVEVKPYPYSDPGEYPITIKVSSPEGNGEAALIVVLTGTHKLDIGTMDGLLSLNAMRGQEANLSFYLVNNGTATQKNINFLSFKPENWKVEFNPENIDIIQPSERKQVEVRITPSEQALVGDYSLILSTEGGKEPKNLELRVTVKASTAWGWIGIGIILIVIIGLIVLFMKFGRR